MSFFIRYWLIKNEMLLLFIKYAELILMILFKNDNKLNDVTIVRIIVRRLIHFDHFSSLFLEY